MKHAAKLGILVVGQSPRPEVAAEFTRLLPNVDLIQRGCLDDLNRAEINALAPIANETTLFTRLPSGDGVTLSKSAVMLHGTAQLDALEKFGASKVCLLCTGEFPDWDERNILLPSMILRNLVYAVQPKGHLGILSPLESQLDSANGRWSSKGHQITSVALSPNASSE